MSGNRTRSINRGLVILFVDMWLVGLTMLVSAETHSQRRASEPTIHVWEKHEITLTAAKEYPNPYTDVEVSVELTGPAFQKRVYGFWDGGRTFRVRVVATEPGIWRWRSHSNQIDSGLNGQSGSFQAAAWADSEKAANDCRRGFLRPTANGQAFAHADGTPFFLLGDTWWTTPTFRFPWHDDGEPSPVGPNMGFQDYVRYRKSQGFNCVAMIVAHPAWANDGASARLVMPDGTVIRRAWQQSGTHSAKDMFNEGGRPFLFPGRVPGYEQIFPDINCINPDYFHYLDRKIDYLNSHGFIPFIEPARRDVSQAWKKYYQWPESYARYVHYVWNRYGANNCLLSLIHFDTPNSSVPAADYNAAGNLIIEKYGPPPFGQLVATNASGTSRSDFGGPAQAKWLTFDMAGNGNRGHDYYERYLTADFLSDPPRPGVNGEPYYAGWKGPAGGTKDDNLNCRSAMYGSVLSGALGGHIYGAHGIWGGDIEDAAPIKMWEALQWKSAAQMTFLRTFVLADRCPYWNLVPHREIVSPNESGNLPYRGWAFAARTDNRKICLLYFEKDSRRAVVSQLRPNTEYVASWFNTRSGEWIDADRMTSNAAGRTHMPPFPGHSETATTDWGLRLIARIQ